MRPEVIICSIFPSSEGPQNRSLLMCTIILLTNDNYDCSTTRVVCFRLKYSLHDNLCSMFVVFQEPEIQVVINWFVTETPPTRCVLVINNKTRDITKITCGQEWKTCTLQVMVWVANVNLYIILAWCKCTQAAVCIVETFGNQAMKMYICSLCWCKLIVQLNKLASLIPRPK